MRAVLDQHVDRPDVDAQQCVQLTGPNRSIALENSPRSPSADTHARCQETEARCQDDQASARRSPHDASWFLTSWHPTPTSAATTGWPWRGCPTRSHPELDRETPQRRWYCVSRRGRVGRRPALTAEDQKSQTDRDQNLEPLCLTRVRRRHRSPHLNAKTLHRARTRAHGPERMAQPLIPVLSRSLNRGVEQPGSSSGS